MAKRKNSNKMNRQPHPNGRRSFIALVIVVLAIFLGFLLLEKLKHKTIESYSELPATSERHLMPQRPEVVQPPLSSAMPIKPKSPEPVIPYREKRRAGPGSIAIIVDDMGGNLGELQSFIGIPVPLTFAIIPGLARSREVANAAHQRGYEVILHIPMEPKGYEDKPFEKDGLLLRMSDQEIERRLNGYLQRVPHAVGANNHMGSRFTEQEDKMRTVLNLLKARGLYFIDSKTSSRSVGDRLAREMGIDTAARAVFLDNVQDSAAISRQLSELATIARRHGSAIGICHPHHRTLQTLAAQLPNMRREGITFVYASELVR